MSAFPTIWSGSDTPTDARPAPQTARGTAEGSATVELVASAIVGLQGDGLGIRQRALDQAGQDLARARLDEPLGPSFVQGLQRLGPLDRPDQGPGQLLADVGEGPGGRAGIDGHPW